MRFKLTSYILAYDLEETDFHSHKVSTLLATTAANKGSQGNLVQWIGLPAGWPGFNSQQELRFFFLFATVYRPALGPTHPPMQYTRDSFPEVKRP
jgi:hypothetical protein